MLARLSMSGVTAKTRPPILNTRADSASKTLALHEICTISVTYTLISQPMPSDHHPVQSRKIWFCIAHADKPKQAPLPLSRELPPQSQALALHEIHTQFVPHTDQQIHALSFMIPELHLQAKPWPLTKYTQPTPHKIIRIQKLSNLQLAR